MTLFIIELYVECLEFRKSQNLFARNPHQPSWFIVNFQLTFSNK